MINCFIDSIGLQQCADVEPPSGLYLSSLPGLTVEAIDHIADSEQVTYLGVYADVQKLAMLKFASSIKSEIGKCYKLNKECDYDAMICENVEVFYEAWMYLLGVHVMIYRINSPRLNWVTNSVEQAQELKDHYQVEYEAALKAAVQLMDVSACELCCGSGGSISYEWRLP